MGYGLKEWNCSVNQDTYFHLSRIIGLDNVWSSPVNFNNFDHHGTMMNIFYPWLTLYPAFLFYKMMGNLVLSYNISDKLGIKGRGNFLAVFLIVTQQSLYFAVIFDYLYIFRLSCH
ncbi:hypothetical protein EfmJHP38_05790 [Enterococcus faecium]|nr:hypothetical protein EfmJHP38_05790 [Enterococcus faecium]